MRPWNPPVFLSRCHRPFSPYRQPSPSRFVAPRRCLFRPLFWRWQMRLHVSRPTRPVLPCSLPCCRPRLRLLLCLHLKARAVLTRPVAMRALCASVAVGVAVGAAGRVRARDLRAVWCEQPRACRCLVVRGLALHPVLLFVLCALSVPGVASGWACPAVSMGGVERTARFPPFPRVCKCLKRV